MGLEPVDHVAPIASAIGVILFGMIFVATIFILRFRRQVAIEIA